MKNWKIILIEALFEFNFKSFEDPEVVSWKSIKPWHKLSKNTTKKTN